MKTIVRIGTFLLVFSILSCGNKKEEKQSFAIKKTKTTKVEKKEESSTKEVAASKRIDLENKGVGPISAITIDTKIDETMAAKGAEIFKKMCTACHRIGKKFIGPAPNNILERRSPEWAMNMILNPSEMVQKDPLAKALLIEFNGSPMSNQNLTEEEARAVLEYFRTL